MKIEETIQNLIQEERNRERRFILFMLLKFSSNIQLVSDKDHHLPLLYLKNDRFVLFFKDEEIDDFEYPFSDYEDILIVMQKIFSDSKVLYLYFDIEKPVNKEEILEKIDQAIDENDIKSFKYYASILNDRQEKSVISLNNK